MKNEFNHVSLALLLAILSPLVQNLKIISTEEKSCKVTTDKGKIDLSPLAGTKTPKFNKQASGSAVTFYWNPCNNVPVSGQGDCDSVEICEYYYGSYTTNLGTKEESQFIADGEHLILQYNHDAATVKIHLNCGSDDKDDFELGTNAKYWDWSLTSKHACFIKPTAPPPPPGVHQLSAGTVLIIGFIALAALYLIFGVLYMRFVRKASGCDLCPNLEMWKALPGNIKEGAMFLFRGCKPRYESI